MATMIKCNYCNNKVDKTQAYSPTGKSPWYCSENHYQLFMKEKKDKEELRQYLFQLFNISEKANIPFLNKKMNELLNVYPVEQILATFKGKSKDINYWLSRDDKFKTTQSKISYVFAIVSNSIIDYKIEPRKNNLGFDTTDIDLLSVLCDNNSKETKNGIERFL